MNEKSNSQAPREKDCNHLDEDCRSVWKYVGDKLESASGYCTLCGQEFVLDEATGHLAPGNQKLYNARKAYERALAEAKK